MAFPFRSNRPEGGEWSANVADDAMLEARNLCKYYGARLALSNVAFSIGKGETVGFLGVNGAGKSTTMRILTGFIAPTYGQALIMGRSPEHPEARRHFGYLPESNPLPRNMRAGEYLLFRSRLKGFSGRAAKAEVARAAERTQTTDSLDRIIGQLSKGYRQRVGLADALIGSPPLLILDEPTSGLDPEQAGDIRSLIRGLGNEGTTVFLSSHILHDVDVLCPRIVVINRGEVAADGPTAEICEKNVDERVISLEITTKEPVRETLRAIPGVRAIAVKPREGEEAVNVLLTIPAGVDLRREISNLCAGRGWLVTEMHLEPIRLEDIFRRLVRQ